ncbi:DUF2237 family protein [Oxynema aestuarii]|jgi:uncharacterized protein (DUF2237 family)|uniref:DUF2237 domain-containing protein n=1 Tax=Oxynema aestuarii AP17 TaxID=2064643 RepID=A0A6H1U3G2_9CYAN|nr:DUF2237 domain-containing protein [Oxynema aestuarii]QIZ72159.1 DUF2237 domain-containing protein [Oxynema aestuarii AP17]RMH72200.1 MAG: DUF2237 domain-containing protein [Cyanobacteria bacterium J007]
MNQAKNVLGTTLKLCGTSPTTGFYRDGCCHTGPDDRGVHTVCAQVSAEFLEFTKAQGNDLSTPMPMFGFPGLKPGDRWCLCASRWKEALDSGFAPPIVLEATHEATLNYIPIDVLKEHAIDL